MPNLEVAVYPIATVLLALPPDNESFTFSPPEHGSLVLYELCVYERCCPRSSFPEGGLVAAEGKVVAAFESLATVLKICEKVSITETKCISSAIHLRQL